MVARVDWRVRAAAIGLAAVCLALSGASAALVFVGGASALCAGLCWRFVLIVRDGVLYVRWLWWADPFLVDSVASVRVEWRITRLLVTWDLVMVDRTGRECTISLALYDDLDPLLEYLVWLLESDPSIRREPTTVAQLRKHLH